MSPSDSLPDLTGHLVDEGRLQIMHVLDAGSYGVVYKALDTTSPTPAYFAVKCLGPTTQHTTREVELHSLCSPHASVSTLHRQFYSYGCHCIVLELSVGDLWASIEDGVFTDNNALVKQTFLQILDAVRFCHQRGVHHRDLKPANILCNADGSDIRIADFGLALDDELPCAVAAGTSSYMTPESLTLGRTTEFYEPEQSDVWACCIILLNMMSGRSPWRKAIESDYEWVRFLTDDKHLRRQFPISDKLNDLIERSFRPVAGSRPTLLQLRMEIATMTDLFVPQETLAPARLLTVPSAVPSTSAPSTLGASFSFNASDYASSALTSNATSIFVELAPVRASDVIPSKPRRTSAFVRPSMPATPSASVELSPAVLEMLARLRAHPPPREPIATPISPPPPAVKKSTRNPLRRLFRWIKKTRRADA
ncbi:kinase-like domain-containing protein [Mycena filopes]|nr:kinase-like domain-containing protein [Mycena filopes]